MGQGLSHPPPAQRAELLFDKGLKSATMKVENRVAPEATRKP